MPVLHPIGVHVDKKKEATMKEWPIQYAYLRMAQRE
jgi:hypothetical protein